MDTCIPWDINIDDQELPSLKALILSAMMTRLYSNELKMCSDKWSFVPRWHKYFSFSAWGTQNITVFDIFRMRKIEYKPLSRIVCDSSIKLKVKLSKTNFNNQYNVQIVTNGIGNAFEFENTLRAIFEKIENASDAMWQNSINPSTSSDILYWGSLCGNMSQIDAFVPAVCFTWRFPTLNHHQVDIYVYLW